MKYLLLEIAVWFSFLLVERAEKGSQCALLSSFCQKACNLSLETGNLRQKEESRFLVKGYLVSLAVLFCFVLIYQIFLARLCLYLYLLLVLRYAEALCSKQLS